MAKLYVSGPMRGYPKFNFEKFDEVCAHIRSCGHIPLGPQEFDRLCGVDENLLTEADVTCSMAKAFIVRDIILLLHEAEGVVVLPGWESSSGARLEVLLAQYLKLPIMDERLVPINLDIRIRQWPRA